MNKLQPPDPLNAVEFYNRYYIIKTSFRIFFFHVQEDMNLSENLRQPIRNRDMATKVDMLCSFKRRQMASQVNERH